MTGAGGGFGFRVFDFPRLKSQVSKLTWDLGLEPWNPKLETWNSKLET